MNLRHVIAAAIAAGFALPAIAQSAAQGNSILLAQGTGGTTTSPAATHPQGRPAASAPAGAPTGPSGHALPGTTGASSGAMSGHGMMDRNAFSAMDKDNDGQISRAEWDAHSASAGSSAAGATTGQPARAIPDSPSSGGPMRNQGAPTGGMSEGLGKNPR